MIAESDLLPAVSEASPLPTETLVRKAKRAADLAQHATAERTRKAYASEFASFDRWCGQHGARSLPTSPAVLATYLADLHAMGRAVASLGVARAAVLFAHKEAGHALDTRFEGLRKVLAGARRTRKADPKRVRPFLIEDFLELSPRMGDGLEVTRDRAMLALGLARALRGPSELMTLDLDRIGSPDARGFVEIGAAGITVHLVRSKTSQEATRSFFVERGPTVEAVEAWIRMARIASGTPLWRDTRHDTVGADRLSARTWARVIKRRVAQLYRLRGFKVPEAKAEAAKYATHSLRAGTITSLADAGASLAEIRDVTGHAEGSASIILGYMRRQGAGVKQIKKLGL